MAVLYSQKLCVCLLLLWAAPPAVRSKCIFDEIQGRVRPVRAAPSPTPALPSGGQVSGGHEPLRPPRAQSTLRFIRIRTWLLGENELQVWPEKRNLEAAVDEAVRTVSSLLSDVNKYCKFLWRNASSVNYNRCGRANKSYRNETCLDVTIPDEHLEGCGVYPNRDSPQRTALRTRGPGLEGTDFLLYLQVRATDKCRAEPNVRAYAAHCQTGRDGRPLAGVVVVCREKVIGVTFDHDAAVQTLVHELFHALGFSVKLFGAWRDCSASNNLGCSRRAKMLRPDASGQMRIYAPSVTSALREHLQTSDPDVGGPLENMGAGPSGVSSHWESRVMQGSIMAAVLGAPPTVRVDPVTLAALRDTGWYGVDLERAQGLVWGKGEGALFGSTSTCKRSSPFFCSGSAFGCHYLHLHKGQCQSDQYLDGCRIYKPIQNGSECWKLENAQQASPDEVFGFGSRCFFSSLSRQGRVMNSSVAGRCYKHRCTGLNRFQVQARGSAWVDCPAGGAVQIKGFQGLVWCPDRRLCLPDVSPLPRVQLSDPEEPEGESWSIGAVVAASACSLVLVLTVSRRWCKVRVHSRQDDVGQAR